MASYLNPRPTDEKLIEAVRAHYPIGYKGPCSLISCKPLSKLRIFSKGLSCWNSERIIRNPTCNPTIRTLTDQGTLIKELIPDVKTRLRCARCSSHHHGTIRTVTGGVIAVTTRQGLAENYQNKAPTPLTQMHPHTRDDKSKITTITIRETNNWSY
jgi:hypothetical protein